MRRMWLGLEIDVVGLPPFGGVAEKYVISFSILLRNWELGNSGPS